MPIPTWSVMEGRGGSLFWDSVSPYDHPEVYFTAFPKANSSGAAQSSMVQ